MSKVPIDDLPSNMVPTNDLPSNLVPSDDLPNIATQESTNQIGDIAQGLLSGLFLLPRAAGELSNQYLRPMLTGKEPLTQQELNDALGQVGASKYEPKTIAGNVANFAGELASTLLLPEVAVIQKLGTAGKVINSGLTGAEQLGIYEALKEAEKGGNAGQVVQAGLGGAELGAGLGAAGTVIAGGIEKSAPYISQVLSKIPADKYKQARELIRQGSDIFKGKINPADEYKALESKINEGINKANEKAGQQVFEEANKLIDKGKLSLSDINKALNESISDFTSTGSKLNTAEETASINKINNWIKEITGQNKKPSIILDQYGNPVKGKIEDATLTSLHNLKQLVQGLAKYDTPNDAIANRFYKNFADKLNIILKKDNPEYAQANKLFEDLQRAQKEVGKINPSKLANAETRTNELNQYKKSIQELDKFLPKENQISSDLEKTLMREAFSGGPTRTGFGIGSVGLGYGAGALNPGLALAGAGTLAASSPTVQRLLLEMQLLEKAGKLSPYAIRTGAVGYEQGK